MKKIYLSLVAIFLVSVSNSQTLTATNHAPSIGEIIKTTDASTAGITPGGIGSNQNWNFSSITLGSTNLVYTVVATSSTGSASTYPSANVAVSSGTNNSFYSTSANDYKYWGGNLVLGGLNATLTYTSAAFNAKYPMSLNTNTTSAVGGTLSAAANNGVFVGTSTVAASGTGTLQLPGRTFNNVIKITNTQILNYSVSVISGTVTQVVNEYYEPGLSKTPLFSITQSTISSIIGFPPPQTSTQVAAYVNTDYLQVGIKESVKEIAGLNIYPNPAKNTVNIQFNNENAETATLEIINALGQSVKKESLSATKGSMIYSANVSELNSGIYFFKLAAGNAVSVRKITIE